MPTRRLFAARMRLDGWGAETDALERKARKVREDAKAGCQGQLRALRTERMEGQESEAVTAATEDRWEQLRAETKNAWDALRDSVEACKAHLIQREYGGITGLLPAAYNPAHKDTHGGETRTVSE